MSRCHHLEQLREFAPLILPSLLLCDFGDLRGEIKRLEQAGVRSLHLDVMDGHFVPNFTYGLPIVAAIRKLTELPLDVHLMISSPEDWVQSFADAGADLLTIHAEASESPEDVLEKIRKLDVAAGIAINPATPLATIENCHDMADLVLIMSVPAGFGGQSFDDIALEKISTLRSKLGPKVLIEVDGGINSSTISRCAQAGAELFVVGSAIFNNEEYGTVVSELAHLASSV